MSLLIISFFIIIVVTSLSMGIGLSLSDKLPYRYRPISKLFLSPVIGISILLIYSIPVGYFVVNKSLYFLAFAFVSFCLLLQSIKNNPINIRSLLTVNIFMLVGSIFSTLLTVLYYGEFNPFNDTYTYIVHSQWLQSHAFLEKAISSGFYPALSQVTLYQQVGERVGSSFLMAIIQSGLSINWSYYVYPAMLSIGLGFGALASGGLITFISHPDRKKLLFSTLIIFIMPSGYVYGAFTGFYPMTYGLLFIIGLVSFLAMSVDFIIRNQKNNSILIVLSSIMFSAFLYAYSNYFPFLLLALSVSFIFILFWNKEHKKYFFIFLIFVISLIIIFVNVELKRMAINLITTISIGSGGVAIGWPIYWTPIEFLGFMAGLKSGFNGPLPIKFVDYLYSLLILSTIVFSLYYGFKEFRKKRIRIFVLIPIALIFASLVIFLKMRYLTPGILPLEQGATFLQLKTAKYASPFVIILLISSFFIVTRKFKFINKYSVYFLVSYFFLAVIHNYIAMKNINGDFIVKVGSPAAYNELLNVKKYIDNNIDINDVIYLDLPGPLHKLRQMVAYVLLNRKVSGNYTDDGYIHGRVPESERNMPINEAQYIIRHTNNNFATPKSDVIKRFGNLFLIENNPLSLIFKKRVGGYGSEYDNDGMWNWTSKKIEYVFHSNNSANVMLNFYYHSMIENSQISLTIYNDSEIIKQSFLNDSSGDVVTDGIYIKPNSLVRIVFESNKNGKKFNKDPRDLNFLIKNIRFTYE